MHAGASLGEQINHHADQEVGLSVLKSAYILGNCMVWLQKDKNIEFWHLFCFKFGSRYPRIPGSNLYCIHIPGQTWITQREKMMLEMVVRTGAARLN